MQSCTWSNPTNYLTFPHSLVCMAINSPSFCFHLKTSLICFTGSSSSTWALNIGALQVYNHKVITNCTNPHIHGSRLCIIEPKHKIACVSLPLNLPFFQDPCLCKWHPNFSAQLLKPKTWKLSSSASKTSSSINHQVLSTLVPTYF